MLLVLFICISVDLSSKMTIPESATENDGTPRHPESTVRANILSGGSIRQINVRYDRRDVSENYIVVLEQKAANDLSSRALVSRLREGLYFSGQPIGHTTNRQRV